MRKIILFDLDGTLIESGKGIVKSLQYAIDKLKLPYQTDEALQVFIGPPLLEQFMSYFKIPEEKGKKAVELYHDRYHPIGLFEAKPYDGIDFLLKKLQEENYVLGVASSKPEYLVKEVLEHFDFTQYFEVIVGSGEGSLRNTKSAVIKEALSRLSADKSADQIWMVGDKEHDVLGAREEEIPCISVLYGYGTKEELKAVQPLKIVDSTQELLDYLLRL
ncbi:HAD-IA family hydrolase [Vagococcus carniphilus]|uniref:HAD-IA family hydrolase n=1 Tax=Vagococcus carniphilus TaxID=218144 RepID=UPI002891477C|nr:HAD-IA family hydrolase [Vagococcus carniphilus]MDT2849426.1 HAD-IA family hydrolase [Vagococcus carniphilus]